MSDYYEVQAAESRPGPRRCFTLKTCCLSETIEATKASTRAPPSLSSLSLPPRRLSLAAPTKKRPTPERREREGEDDREG